MIQTLKYNHGKTKRNIILVGVAGVGKTTLGKLASEKLDMLFVDVEMQVEDLEGSDIDTLLERYGEEGFRKRLLIYFVRHINRDKHTIFTAPGLIMECKKFWEAARLNGTSIHLRGKPLEVYMRQDVWVNEKKLTKKEKLKKEWKDDFYNYYEWRLRHCQKADYTVRIIGNKQADTESLCKKIAELIPIESLVSPAPRKHANRYLKL